MSKPQLNLVSQTLRALNPRSVQTIKIMIVSCPCLHSKKKKCGGPSLQPKIV